MSLTNRSPEIGRLRRARSDRFVFPVCRLVSTFYSQFFNKSFDGRKTLLPVLLRLQCAQIFLFLLSLEVSKGSGQTFQFVCFGVGFCRGGRAGGAQAMGAMRERL